jgi:hypothetical protein
MASRSLGLYRSEVGNHLPTSPKYLSSKRAQYLPIKDQNLSILLKKPFKNIYNKVNKTTFGKIRK